MHRAVLVIALLSLGLSARAQTGPAAHAGAPAANSDSVAPVDRAYLQSIWDGWASADLEKQGRFYAQGPNHLFFDVAPLKYGTWDEYRAGVAPSLKDSPKVTYTLNDDLQIHPAGPYTWAAGTLEMAGASPQGAAQKLTLRWTAVLELKEGRWVITHEHVSAAAEGPGE
jgi:ketosteroid isomerase-like protein